MKKLLTTTMLICAIQISFSQTDKEAVTEVLTHYIEGTANGEPERLKIAFHPEFNLYFVKNDSVTAWKGSDYIGNVKEGQKSNRIGKIIDIDITNDAATAKVEIDMPERKRLYTDYFLLLKTKGDWQIVHKSFTYVTY
ncbi:nuclear transport factor 2 family protein [Maribacter halichondriae]|uniref:nuclear transport factor 2 family protein n=1 Tax=Maribacter halichondriae TaxID=2980554 RepID=UPI0023596B1A|nr:nuclear transport factor 2 family protein [Maribacter sp. Hal144]